MNEHVSVKLLTRVDGIQKIVDFSNDWISQIEEFVKFHAELSTKEITQLKKKHDQLSKKTEHSLSELRTKVT